MTMRPRPGHRAARAPRCPCGQEQLPPPPPPQPRRRAPGHRCPGVRLARPRAAAWAPAAGPAIAPGRRDKLPPSGVPPAALPSSRAAGTPAGHGAASSPPGSSQPRAPRLRSNKAGAPGDRARGWERRRGLRGAGGGPPSRRGGEQRQRKGRKVSRSGRGRLASSARPRSLCAPRPPARPPERGRPSRRRRGGMAWRAGRPLTSVQGERLDRCQRRHVCGGSPGAARLQRQRPFFSEKKRRRLGAGVGREAGKEGGGGGGRRRRCRGRRLGWVGSQMETQLFSLLRTDLPMPRGAEQVPERPRRRPRGGGRCPTTSLLPPPAHTRGPLVVWLSFNFPGK